jgi:neutral ceramidase
VTLRAGFGRSVITPSMPVMLAGFGARTESANEVHDDLEARALHMESDGIAVTLVVCDLLGMSEEFSNPVRDAIAEDLGLPRAAVLTACTHTHSGPSSIAGSEGLGWPVPDGYERILIDGCRRAAGSAKEAAGEASVHFVRASLPDGLSHNRRGNPYEPWFTLLDLRKADGGRIGTLANLAVHPVSLGPEWMTVSGDWVGSFRAELERLAGGSSVMVSGPLGDVNPRDWATYEGPGGVFERTDALGKDLAAVVADELQSTRPIDPKIAVFPPRLVEAKTSETPLAALSGRDSISCELVEWAIGDVRLVSIPGEAFQAFGREVDQVRRGRTILAGISPSWQGYFPHPWGAGYEETVSFGEPVVTAVLEELKKVPDAN